MSDEVNLKWAKHISFHRSYKDVEHNGTLAFRVLHRQFYTDLYDRRSNPFIQKPQSGSEIRMHPDHPLTIQGPDFAQFELEKYIQLDVLTSYQTTFHVVHRLPNTYIYTCLIAPTDDQPISRLEWGFVDVLNDRKEWSAVEGYSDVLNGIMKHMIPLVASVGSKTFVDDLIKAHDERIRDMYREACKASAGLPK